ncbi:MAG: phage tail sheath family protein [Bacteroidia bacterium]
MANFKTPGVYIEEIPTLGSSIAPVATAIPGFTGYTEKAIINGSQWNYGTGPTYKPAPAVRITSLLEYVQTFGLPYQENYGVTLTDPSVITIARNTPANQQNYVLYYQMQMFFANGGSTCWVVSVGDYTSMIDPTALSSGLDVFQGVDEVTLLLIPDAISLSAAFRKELNDDMLAQCAKLGDRFAVMDVHTGAGPFNDGSNFRNTDVGPDNLKYGAAYYPSFASLISYSYLDNQVIISDMRSTPVYNTAPNNTLFTITNGIASFQDFAVSSGVYVAADTFKLTVPIGGTQYVLTPGQDFPFGATVAEGTSNLVNAINAHPVLSNYVVASTISPSPDFRVMSKIQGLTAGSYLFDAAAAKFTPTGTMLTGGADNSQDKALYNQIKALLDAREVTLYPSGTMVGIYSRVDNARGVWQSPANVGVLDVDQLSVLVTDAQQQDLNIDSTSGKSINAIRKFNGRGNVVWGARTLAGNDNEWRYINVRRLFIMIEESVKNATEFVVFEPNTANTWQRVKGMIDAFLTDLWRDGALAGAVPSDAFFVQVGLGTTMTADDILNGIMNVRIGIAAVRPAEFIILQFSHKLQVS